MIRVLGCIANQHDIRLVILATMVCAAGTYSALSVLSRASEGSRKNAMHWIVASAAVGGATVWATHFVAMLAYHAGTATGYDLGLTVLSIAFAIVLTLVAFLVAVQLRQGLAGGAVFGVAIAAMHYTGMAALNATARFEWNMGDVTASILIGIAFGALALAVFTRRSSMVMRVAAAGLMTLAIAGLHFTAMTALVLVPDPTVQVTNGPVVAQEWLAVAVAAVMFAILTLGLITSAVDNHLAQRAQVEAQRLRTHVTELETTKRELEEATARLGRALESAAAASQAKSQFLASMSHELRTPLNAIIGFSELMAREVFGPVRDTRYKDYIAYVLKSGQHLLSLVNDVLDFSKIEAGCLELQDEEVDVAVVAAEAANMVRTQAAEADIAVSVGITPDLPALVGDHRRVRQILINLLSNAVKFTCAGGSVSVGADNSEEAGLCIRVADTGIGIAAEDIPRVLDRFTQLDSSLARKHDGTGLGLPLANRLVQAHGGTLTIESAPGVGTTVLVRFPPARTKRHATAA